MSDAGRRIFGHMPAGEAVERIVLTGANGFAVAILTYGAAIQSILAPDAAGTLADVVLGHDDLAGYRGKRDFFGATIGRYANRIAGGAFTLGGREWHIAPNDGPNALHGGAGGFDTRLFAVRECDRSRLVLARRSPAGEEGFPGTLDVTVTFAVEETTLAITYEAVSDAETVVNLTNHAFFNLRGTGTALDHELCLEADAILPVTADAIPTGEPLPVAGTPFDFRTAAPIGARIREAHPQLAATGGYDHNFCLRAGRAAAAQPAARLFDPASGRAMVLATSEPGLQFYSGNKLDGAVIGKNGRLYRQGDGLCLEPQAYPDSPNHPRFPATALAPGDVYRHWTRYHFTTGRS